MTHLNCQRKLGIDGIQSFLYYSEEMQKVMKELKYSQVRDAYQEIFWSLNPEIVSKIAVYGNYRPSVYIQPLPLHNRRLRDRGFNQAELFANYISHISNIPVIDALERVKDMPQQVRQGSRWQRFINSRNAFRVKKTAEMKGKTIVLFDDVITTGSTVKEACRTLKMAGATHVFALSLLRD
jgi:ComF family protein